MAFLVWLEAFRSTWAVGPDQLIGPPVGGLADVRAPTTSSPWTSTPVSPGIDLSIGGRGASRVVVPLDEWRHRPGAVGASREFLGNAERRGAPIDPRVWDALRKI